MKRWLDAPGFIYLALAVVSVCAYLAVSAAGGHLGFPLDDAWIHQTYGRNLGQRLEFAFVPGQPSAGSTAPLWTALIAVGYALRLDYGLWTYALGAVLLGVNAGLVHRLVARLWPGSRAAPWVAGLLAVTEWHMVWSAASGMELLAFTAAVLLVFMVAPTQFAWMGAAAGLALWLRPDGLSLLPFALLRAAWQPQPEAADEEARFSAALGVAFRRAFSVKRLVGAGAVFGVFFAGYMAFNQAVGGTPWPNTLYAKQAEYAILRELPFITRLFQLVGLPFVGSAALMVPGLGLCLVVAARTHKRWEVVLPIGWAAILVLAYAWRLPVTYQHGRYLMPAIPILIACGVGGLWPWLRLSGGQMLARVVSRAWMLTISLVAAGFWLLGARAYANDVRFIETEMVLTARWLAANTEPQALIAAHDIGALGFFAGRDLLDLAGLVSPEVIPFIRDEARLADWLNERGAEYLVTFPGWYPSLTQPDVAEAIYVTESAYSPSVGGENMVVFRWIGPPD